MKIKQKSYVKLEPKSRDPYFRRTDGGMIQIVKEIESGLITIRTACDSLAAVDPKSKMKVDFPN